MPAIGSRLGANDKRPNAGRRLIMRYFNVDLRRRLSNLQIKGPAILAPNRAAAFLGLFAIDESGQHGDRR